MDSAVFSEKVANVVRDVRVGRVHNASLVMHEVLVERLTSETRETLGTPGETDPDTAFDNIIDETTMEMVIALADQSGAGVRYVTETVDDFISAHVRPLKESIISGVEANLGLPEPSQRGSRQVDNDIV